MTIEEAMYNRHSVRAYMDEPIDDDAKEALQQKVDEINAESGLKITLFFDEPEAFSGKLAKYGKFKNCKNYAAIVAKNDEDEKVGYFGEKLVIFAQSIGINSCWVGLTYNKKAVNVNLGDDERLLIVIALGYGETQGSQHKNRQMKDLCTVENAEMPNWFLSAMSAAMTAPTAVNQQKFHFTLSGDTVKAKALFGPYSRMDLGIVKYHFELGAGGKNFKWV